jgi:hypothetical protein
MGFFFYYTRFSKIPFLLHGIFFLLHGILRDSVKYLFTTPDSVYYT